MVIHSPSVDTICSQSKDHPSLSNSGVLLPYRSEAKASAAYPSLRGGRNGFRSYRQNKSSCLKACVNSAIAISPRTSSKEMYETHSMPQEIAGAYRDAGFGLMGIPEEYGGIPADKGYPRPHDRRAVSLQRLHAHPLSELSFYVRHHGVRHRAAEAGCCDHYMETGWPIASLSISGRALALTTAP